MPYIEVKLAKQASRKQERILTEKLFRLDTGGQLQITENGHIIVFCYFFHSYRSSISAGNEPGAVSVSTSHSVSMVNY